MSKIQVFAYPHSPTDNSQPCWNGYGEADGETGVEARLETDQEQYNLESHSLGQSGNPPLEKGQAGPGLTWEKRLAEETRKAFDAGREQGLEEARRVEREALAKGRGEETQRLAGAMETFSTARDRYLHAVEKEAVKLALAVAARILRREAQMDPLLLTGAIRVALGQLCSTTVVRLQVPAADLELWREAMAHLPNLAVRPEVVAGDGLRLGECVLDSSLGTVDLGIRSQLGEIERGFFDRAGGDAGGEARKQQPALEGAN